MTNPIYMVGVAGSAVTGIAKGVTEVINTKEHQRTVRLQSQMGAAVNGAECVQQIVNAYCQYKTVVENERTERRNIERWEKETLRKIEVQRDFLLTFLDRSFDERARNFQALFEVLDQVIASRDSEHLGLVLDKITELAKSSPFKDLTNLSTVQAALADPNHEWKF
jgi:peptidyl-tRNA hydrolase